MVCKKILLPAPFGPKTAVIELLLILQFILSKIIFWPKTTDKSTNCIGVKTCLSSKCFLDIHSPLSSIF